MLDTSQRRSLGEINADLAKTNEALVLIAGEAPSGDRVLRRADLESQRRALELEREVAQEEAQAENARGLEAKIEAEEQKLPELKRKVKAAQDRAVELWREQQAALASANAAMAELNACTATIERTLSALEYAQRTNQSSPAAIRAAAYTALDQVRFVPSPSRSVVDPPERRAGAHRIFQNYLAHGTDARLVDAITRYIDALPSRSEEYRDFVAAVQRRVDASERGRD